MAYTIQPSFSGGEFSPSLYSRIDIQKYSTALRKAKNAIVHPQGGVSNRPGTKYLGTTKFPTKKSRIIPFEISLTNTYAVECGEYYFRFYKNDGLILNAGLPYEVVHPFSENELAEIKYVQSNDVLFIVHPNYKPKKLIHYTDTNWVLEDLALSGGPFMNKQLTGIPNFISPNIFPGSTGTLIFPSDYLTANHVGSLFKLNYSIQSRNYQTSLTAATYFTEDAVAETGMKLTLSGTWTGSVVVQLSTDSGNTWSDVATKTANVTNELYTCSGAANSTNNRYRLKVTALSAGTVNYTLNGNASDYDGTLVYSARIKSGSIATTLNYTPSILCRGTWRVFTRATWTGMLTVERSTDGTNWEAIQSFSSTASAPNNVDIYGTQDDLALIRVRGAITSGSINLDLSHDSFECEAILKIGTYYNSKSALCQIIKAIPNGSATSFQEGSFSAVRGYPRAVIFYQDRLCLASTASQPQATWMSQTGNYVDFSTSTEIQDTDSISINLPSRKTNDIKNLVSLKDIICFTSASEWRIGASGDVLTPTTVTQQLQENIGSNSCDPVMIGNRSVFISPMGSVVRDIGYDYSVDGFVGGNLSIFSTHLFEGYEIKEMAYQQEPDSIIWAIRNDGKLLSLTYMREQQVLAWTWHETDGLYESVCTLPGNGINEMYFIVNRDGNRFIEKMGKRLVSTDPADAFFVDSGLTYTGAPTTTISGLTHLNGKTVSVLADGYVLPQKVVTAGSISLGASYSKVTVGLPFETDIETLNIEISVQDGISYGRSMRVSEARIAFLNSRSGYIGGDSSHLDQIQQTSGATLGSALDYFTGELKQPIDTSYDEGGRIFFRQSDPLPITILAIMPKVVFGG